MWRHPRGDDPGGIVGAVCRRWKSLHVRGARKSATVTLEIKPAGISLNFAEAGKQKDDYYYYGSDEKDSKGSKDSKDKKH